MIRELAYHPIFDAQRHFRMLLDGMSRPGKVLKLDDVSLAPPSGLNDASTLIGFALLNADVTFWMAESFQEGIQYLKLNTGTQLAPLEEADFIFLQGKDPATILEEVKIGELQYPENGATSIIHTQAIEKEASAETITIRLEGPGVKDTIIVHVSGLSKAILEMVQMKNIEYPLGIDTILVDTKNQIVCIPRSNKLTIL